MKNICKVPLIVVVFLNIFLVIQTADADSAVDNAITFLKSKQDSSGKITGGFSTPSQWTAIAFVANGIDISAVKNSTNSLKDFLLTDISTNNTATDWESRILAIVAIGENPANFAGANYIQKLEDFYNNNQIGDICALNDDIFGLLALIASGNLANIQIKPDILNFLISKQDAIDGGFSWSTPSCPYYATSSDMTAAALQALQQAKDNGLTHTNLDEAITKAKNYLLVNQNTDGGFGYFGSSDADTTGWVLQAFNVLDMEESSSSARAKNYLISKQQSDGGFPGWSGSDSTTTAQALIALSGKGWLLKVFNTLSLTPSNQASSSATPSPTPSPTPTLTSIPSPTPTPTPAPSPISTTISTVTASPTPSPSPTPLPKPVQYQLNKQTIQPSPAPTPSPEVLGTSSEVIDQQDTSFSPKKLFFSFFSLTNFIGAALYWKLKM